MLDDWTPRKLDRADTVSVWTYIHTCILPYYIEYNRRRVPEGERGRMISYSDEACHQKSYPHSLRANNRSTLSPYESRARFYQNFISQTAHRKYSKRTTETTLTSIKNFLYFQSVALFTFFPICIYHFHQRLIN